MKKAALFLSFALLSAPSIPASAAPETLVGPALDPSAVALLDQSAAAYAKLQGLSIRINSTVRRGEKVTHSSGTLLFSRPSLAKLTLKLNDQERLYLSDGTQVRLQDGPLHFKTPRLQGQNALLAVVGENPLAMNFLLRELVAGRNPVKQANPNIEWRRVAFLGLSSDTITLTMRLKSSGANPAVRDVSTNYQLYFDSKNHLLSRFGAQSRFLYAAETLTEVQINPQFEPGTFSFRTAAVSLQDKPMSR